MVKHIDAKHVAKDKQTTNNFNESHKDLAVLLVRLVPGPLDAPLQATDCGELNVLELGA